MNQNDIVVIAVDGLGASALGAYGNTWFETPCFDELAGESVLAEWCFAPATDLDAVYRSLWTADHPLRALVERKNRHASLTRAEPETLPQLLANQQYHTILLSDDAALQEYAGAQGFAETAWVAKCTGSLPFSVFSAAVMDKTRELEGVIPLAVNILAAGSKGVVAVAGSC